MEIAENLLMERLAPLTSIPRDEILKDVFVTGGYSLFAGFEQRLRTELRAVLPLEAPLGVRKARNPVLDAWRGAARWAADPVSRRSFVTKMEFVEKGPDYLKEHQMGNVYG